MAEVIRFSGRVDPQFGLETQVDLAIEVLDRAHLISQRVHHPAGRSTLNSFPGRVHRLADVPKLHEEIELHDLQEELQQAGELA